MLATVNLDDQTALQTYEIDHKGADRPLTPYLEALQAAVAQQEPQPPFGFGRIAPERPRALVPHSLTRLTAKGGEAPSPAARERESRAAQP